jgi:hypothetical protein
MMARVPERIFIKPSEVDVGRGRQLATVPYPPTGTGRRRVLPPEGDWVTMAGTAGSYWTRRLNERSVERAEPPKAEAAKPEPPAQPASHGKKEGKD